MRILVTRPAEDAQATAERLRELGHEPLIAPLMRIQYRDGGDIALDGVQAILATSANGVRAIARRITRRDVPLFAVGRQTAAEAARDGFAAVRSADGDGAALAEATAHWAKPEDGALLHAAGAQTSGDLAAALTARGFAMQTEILYEAVPAEALSREAEDALRTGNIGAVLLYSPRGARVFAELAGNFAEALTSVTALCISPATTKPLQNLPFRAVLAAERPDQDAMLALVARAGSDL
ncbi:MAG TPA: uroporphyrinogen-III synthase [Rhizomicrobium sp.]|jgi:uroporphyrinogen-III synthase